MKKPFQARHFILGSLFLFLISSATLAQDLTPISINGDSVIAREERYGNMERLGQAKVSSAAPNSPPIFEITPQTRTIKVGEQITFRFAFRDPDNDPYFGGVVASTPRIKLENAPEKRKEALRAAPVLIDVLVPDDPSVIVWNITGQNPGTAIFFISIAEIFASNENGNFKLTSGQLTHTAYVFRVIGDEEDAPGPSFVDRQGDMNLRLKERVRLTFAAASPDNRPLSYGFLFLTYATRLVRGRIGPNMLDLKAIEPGKGLFVAYVTDGRKADVQTFLLTVPDPMDPSPPELKLRSLSANAAVGKGKPISLDLYGENFTAASQAVLKTAAGEERLSTSFLSQTNLKIELPASFNGEASLLVEDGTIQSNSIGFRGLGPILTDVKLVRNNRDAVTRIRIIGLGLGRKPLATADGEMLKLVPEKTDTSRFGDFIVVKVPSRLRDRERLELRFTSDSGLESLPLILPLKK